jgi:hypothetical protein
MTKITDEQIKKLEQYLYDEDVNFEFMMASYKRLRTVLRDFYDEVCTLENKGDI